MDDNHAALVARIEALEQRVQGLMAGTFAIGGVLFISLSIAALRRYRVSTFNHVTTDRLSLVRRSRELGQPDRIALDAYLGPTGPVLNLYGGQIALYGPDRTTPLVQLEGQWAPLSMRSSDPSASGRSGPLGPGEAWVLDRHGNQAELAPLRGRPVLCVYGPDARPGVAVTEVGLIELTPGQGATGTGQAKAGHFGAGSDRTGGEGAQQKGVPGKDAEPQMQ